MALLAALLAGAGPSAPPGPPRRSTLDPAEAERLYRARFAALRASPAADVAAYDPLEPVPGARPPGRLPTARPEERGLDPAAIAAAAQVAEAANSSAFLVWRKGALVAERYFHGTTAETPVVSRSLAKPLAAIAVGRAIALGAIRSLDQPVADFIPEWRGGPKAAIRVRHLLDMRSGLLAQGFSADPANVWSRAYLHPVHERILIEDYPLTDPPGEVFEYSNAAADLVALVVEAATGRRYADFVGREVLAPLGAAGGAVWVNRPGGVAHSGCCILLPARTWLRLALLVKDDGVAQGRRLLPPGFVAEMRTATPQNPHHGLGVWVAGPYVERRGFANPARGGPKVLHSEPYLARDVVLFDGNANQVIYIVPSADLVVMRLGAPPPRDPEWDNATFLNRILRGLRPGEARLEPQPR
ncbi:MAG: beta-lactamase family protein [Sphingomonadaceae bacterium]|uniref:serine hydrolase domain-containing protein n=1 Tax=Thermaurantiacus sp. TaxID=2820283 RepID=UPI00298ED549|nr:serine hydrolase domain-containing protein [Thermaurantiacus sp.]MCS6987571.1 beta-lactamase family protein [Sphingomonadaceae bacterium]MDW8415172.1 serine hydrolase domain-containing protein [Thermaurantiacus sp.]